jgi:hypothetical protein
VGDLNCRPTDRPAPTSHQHLFIFSQPGCAYQCSACQAVRYGIPTKAASVIDAFDGFSETQSTGTITNSACAPSRLKPNPAPLPQTPCQPNSGPRRTTTPAYSRSRYYRNTLLSRLRNHCEIYATNSRCFDGNQDVPVTGLWSIDLLKDQRGQPFRAVDPKSSHWSSFDPSPKDMPAPGKRVKPATTAKESQRCCRRDHQPAGRLFRPR